MKKALIGAGGFAREISSHMNDKNLIFFVDDVFYKNNLDNILPLSKFNVKDFEVLIAVGDPKDRFKIKNTLPKETKYFTFIHPSVQILDSNIKIGNGSVICANCILTTNIIIGEHCHLNLSTTIGHDCIIGDFFTTAPGVHISGNNIIGDQVYFGTNSCTKQKIKICDNVVIGLNSGVTKDINDPGTYVGTPCIKK